MKLDLWFNKGDQPERNVLPTQMKSNFGSFNSGLNHAFTQRIQPYSLNVPRFTDEDVFKCVDCGKVYKSKTSLNLHVRLECGKEPKFSCPFCPKKCHQKGNLKVHIHSKHREEFGSRLNRDGNAITSASTLFSLDSDLSLSM